MYELSHFEKPESTIDTVILSSDSNCLKAFEEANDP